MSIRVDAVRSFFLSGVCGAALLAVPAVAHAQDDGSAAASDATGNSGLQEIVVTAQRRSENSQSVPVSIVSIGGEDIAKAGYTDFTDLQFLAPGLQYDPTQGAAFQIRGVGTTSFDFSNAKSVSVVVDDVVMDGQRANGLIGMVDIDRVDVLMGPQGTLFGKNSTSGVIAVRTTAPKLGVTSVRGSATYGEHNDMNLNATVNVPLGQVAALRVSGFDTGQDGFGRNVTLNRVVGSVHEYGGRAKLLVDPGEGFDVTVEGDYAHHWDSSVRTPVSGQPAAVTALLNSLGVHPGPESADTADSQFGEIETEEWGFSAKLHARVGNNDLTSISSWRNTLYNNNTPADLLPISVFSYIPFNYGHLTTSKVSEEIHFASAQKQTVTYLAGLFYNRLEARQTQLQWGGLGQSVSPSHPLYALSGAIGESGNTSLYNSVNESFAAFGQVQLNLPSGFRLSLGGRYTHDNNSQSLSYITTDPLPIVGFVPTFIPTAAGPIYPSGSVKGDNFSFRVSPEYQITPSAMIYASYTTGYKPAGIAFVGGKYDPYRAETVKAWEVGIKSEWFGHRLRLNLDAFRSDFTDFQATILTAIPDGAGGTLLTTAIGNAGGLRSQGIEGSLTARPIPSLTLGFSGTYTDAWFTDYVYNATTNYTNTRLPNSPDVTLTGSVDYDHDLGERLRLKAHADYSWRSDYWTVVGQPDYSFVPSYGLLNARISVTINGRIEVGAYARNLLDTYYSTGWQVYGALGLLHYTSPGARRTAGGFVNFNF